MHNTCFFEDEEHPPSRRCGSFPGPAGGGGRGGGKHVSGATCVDVVHNAV